MGEMEAARIYERVSAARVPDALMVEAINLVCASARMLPDRSEIVDRLTDDEHALVLRKEVTDVVMLVTGALEAPSVEVFEDFVAYADAQVPIREAFDDVTAILRAELGLKMAIDALDDIVDDRAAVMGRLGAALKVLGQPETMIELAEQL